MNTAKLKSHILKSSEIKNYLECFKVSGIPFDMIVSNYSVKLRNTTDEIHFISNVQSNQMFAAFSKIKKDVRTKEKPEIDYLNIKYYNYNRANLINCQKVINFDIKSAYAKLLFNAGYISETTFKYLARLKKQDRLSSVGMLASKKYIFHYDNTGNLIINTSNPEIIKSDLTEFFYFSVLHTSLFMEKLAEILKKTFLFYWVDGIYLAPKKGQEKIIDDFFRENNLEYSYEVLRDFKAINYENFIYLEYFKKSKKGIYKKKYFNLPKNNSNFATDLINDLKL